MTDVSSLKPASDSSNHIDLPQFANVQVINNANLILAFDWKCTEDICESYLITAIPSVCTLQEKIIALH